MRSRNVYKVLLGFLAMVLLVAHNGIVTRADSEKRVLFISSYSYAWDTVQIQIKGVAENIGENVVLDYEFMDTKRVDDEESARMFYEGLAYRMSKVAPYDVIILGDDAALRFALEHRDGLFAGIPLVFEGINDEDLIAEADTYPDVTGVVEKLSLEKNIEFGLQINPTAKRVVAILDDTITGEAERKRFYSAAAEYPQLKFSEINTSRLTTSQLKTSLKAVSKDSILIYVVMTEDADGKQYTNAESVELLASYANVPAIRMVEGGIGAGLLGGNVVSMYKSGQIAAEMAWKILNGAEPDSIDVVMDSPNIYCVDAAVMEKFDISLKLLPEGTEILNRKETFMEKYGKIFVPGVCIIVFLTAVIIYGVFDIRKRKKLTEQLAEVSKIMETASQHDFLTGIPNRNKLMQDLTEVLEAKTPCTLIMLDIDDFKSINDTLGHSAGDEALQHLGNCLKEMQSQILTSYRYAGDEFIIVLKSCQEKLVQKTVYECQQIFFKPFHLAGQKRNVYGSIGVASYPQDATELEQLINCADEAMYHVKKSGKNDFAFYEKK